MALGPRVCIIVAAVAVLAAAVEAQNGGWPQWRGLNRDGIIVGFTEPSSWPDRLNQRWKIDVGPGYATPLLVGNQVFMFSRQGGDEVMSAIEADSGKVLWRTGYPVSFTMHSAAARHGEGPKSTPAFADGRLYAIGMTGVVTAFDAATGRQLWQKPGSDLVPMYTTHSFSPLVDRGLVIVHVGGHNQGSLTAFDVNTGEVRWSWDGDGPGYGSPILAELDGTRQIVTITEGKVVGVDAASGALLWERPFASPNFTNSITPVLYEQILIVSGNGEPTVAFTVSRRGNQWVTEDVWQNADIPLRMSDAVVAGDVLFGLSNRNMGQYFAVDARTGTTLWLSEGRQAEKAAIQRAGNLLFSLQNDGELVIIRASSTGFEPLRRYQVADSQTWSQPTLSGNRLFVKDETTLALWTLD